MTPKAKRILERALSEEVDREHRKEKIICSSEHIKSLENKFPGTNEQIIEGRIPKKIKPVLTKNQRKHILKNHIKSIASELPPKTKNTRKHSISHKKRVLWKKAKLAIHKATSNDRNISK